MDIKLLEELCQAPGIPGREADIIKIMERELKKSCDEVSIDRLGNVVGIKKSKKKNPLKVMISGHMDEIGFIVSHIDKSGYVRFSPRGGHVPRVLISNRVSIYGKKKVIHGIVEAAPAFLNPDDRLKAPEFKHMFIDKGLPEKELKKEVAVGDVIVMQGAFVSQGDIFISKAFDNRVGCFMVLEAMKELASKNVDVEIIAVGSAQEEVGLRGVTAAATKLHPDIGIALDVTAAFDTPGVSEHERVTKLGEGVAIKINDAASISNHGIVEFMKDIAKKGKIKHQMEILPFGGTDAHGMQLHGGAAVCTLSIPTRFVHSPNEMLHKKDLRAGIDLLVGFLKNAAKCELKF